MGTKPKSKYDLKFKRRKHASSVYSDVLVNSRGDLVGPEYGMEYRIDPDTGERVGHRTIPVKREQRPRMPRSCELTR